MKRKKLKLICFVMIVLILTVMSVFAESGKLSIGVIGGGWVGSSTGEAVKGFSDTEFKSSGVYGGHIMYKFPSGFALELCVEKFSMELEEKGENFGTLHQMPIMLLFKVQWMPLNGTGFTSHIDIGGGINYSSFDIGTYIKGLAMIVEETYDTQVKCIIDTDDSFVFELGGGLDYFFTKNFSMYFDCRFLLGNIGTSWEWKFTDLDIEAPFEDVDTFYASTIQFFSGIRLWF